MSATTFLILLFGVSFIIGIILITFLMGIHDVSKMRDNFLYVPLKFSVRKVICDDDDRYRLYYKRLLFWHKYTICIGLDTYTQLTGSYDKMMKEVNSINKSREENRIFISNNRWWKNKREKIG